MPETPRNEELYVITGDVIDEFKELVGNVNAIFRANGGALDYNFTHRFMDRLHNLRQVDLKAAALAANSIREAQENQQIKPVEKLPAQPPPSKTPKRNGKETDPPEPAA